jgi:hypothetical protein
MAGFAAASPRRSLVILALLAAPPTARAAAWALVTEEEAAASAARGLPPVARSLAPAAAPRIEVLSPSEIAALRPPLSIRLRFAPAAGARVDPGSFRALYGALRLDVTERIRARARIDAEGLAAEDVALPAGQHRILLSVADDQGRRGERDFRLRIE